MTGLLHGLMARGVGVADGSACRHLLHAAVSSPWCRTVPIAEHVPASSELGSATETGMPQAPGAAARWAILVCKVVRGLQFGWWLIVQKRVLFGRPPLDSELMVDQTTTP